MTCADVREQLSALLDDALSVTERSALEAHLATCTDCRRELAALRGTVTLLGQLGPVHAPAGFVDRVVAEVYRPSRLRRFFDVLFRPLRVKLPLEAAAVILVGLSALYVYERTPEVRQLVRPQVPAAVPPDATAPPVTGAAGEAPPAQPGEVRAKVAPAEQELARQAPAPTVAPLAPEAVPVPHGNAVQAPGAHAGATPGPMADLRSETAPAATPEAKSDAKDVKKEAQVEPRRDAASAPAPLAKNEKVAPAPEPAPSRDAVTSRPGAPPAAAGVVPSTAAPSSAGETRGRVGAQGAATPATPPHESAAGGATTAQKSRTAAARLMRAADASGRLVVPATEPAEIALDALLGRLGAMRVARRVEHTPGPVLVDINVPVTHYHELLEGLGKIGRWTTEHEAKTFPSEVRLEVAITVEP